MPIKSDRSETRSLRIGAGIAVLFVLLCVGVLWVLWNQQRAVLQKRTRWVPEQPLVLQEGNCEISLEDIECIEGEFVIDILVLNTNKDIADTFSSTLIENGILGCVLTDALGSEYKEISSDTAINWNTFENQLWLRPGESRPLRIHLSRENPGRLLARGSTIDCDLSPMLGMTVTGASYQGLSAVSAATKVRCVPTQ
ncbi:MAG: hypothetical protein H6815_03375 [Phycisphaeraceae bacterium]|nr:hypothetical protein [Phycisphaerales bacterium]MCB9859468.1 hypothetical protein [Phycisphaeraceae bacterium]